MALSSRDSFIRHEITLGDFTSLRFSLHKFSYSTIPIGHGTAAWSHVKKDSLFAVFDNDSSMTAGGFIERKPKPTISILQGGDTLEVIYLEDLLQQLRIDEARFGGSHVSDSSRNILIIIRKPLVSFRFRLPNGETRRLQLNFATETGYEHTVKTLLATTLPIKDQSVQIEPSILSQTTIRSYRSETQDPFSTSFTPAAITEHHKAESNIRYDLHGALSAGPSSSTNYSDTPTVLASCPRVQSSAGRLEKMPDFDRASRPYQLQPEPTRHPQFATIRQVGQEPLNVEQPWLLRPSSAPVALSNMSIDMLSQILPPKRDLPFAVVPAKRPRPEADSSSTVEESAKSLKVVLKVKKGSAIAAPKKTPRQRVKAKSNPPKTTRSKASVAEKISAEEVAAPKADLREITPQQVQLRDVASKRAIPEPPKPKAVMFTTTKTLQDMPTRCTRSSANANASQGSLSRSLKPSSHEIPPDSATFAVPRPAPKDAATQTTPVHAPQVLMPVSGNANAVPRLALSQEWVDRVEEHLREARYHSTAKPVSEPALVLAKRPAARCDLRVLTARSWEEREVELRDTIHNAIMDENFESLCENVEKVLEGMLSGR